MPDSNDRVQALDFDRDLPTTPEDVEALRAARPTARLGNLENLALLVPPPWFQEREGQRKTFAGMPPFEL